MSEEVKPEAKPSLLDARGKFQKGHAREGGRVKGTPNKVTLIREQLIAALDEVGNGRKGKAFKPGVQEFMKTHAVANPKSLLAMLAKLLPLQITGFNDGPVRVTKEMTEKEAMEAYTAQLRGD